MEILSICVSEIPRKYFKKSEKNGKIYVNIQVNNRKEKDDYGNDLYVTVPQTKEEREAKEPKLYIGQGKTYNFDNKPAVTKPEEVEKMPNMTTNEAGITQDENDFPWDK